MGDTDWKGTTGGGEHRFGGLRGGKGGGRALTWGTNGVEVTGAGGPSRETLVVDTDTTSLSGVDAVVEDTDGAGTDLGDADKGGRRQGEHHGGSDGRGVDADKGVDTEGSATGRGWTPT